MLRATIRRLEMSPTRLMISLILLTVPTWTFNGAFADEEFSEYNYVHRSASRVRRQVLTAPDTYGPGGVFNRTLRFVTIHHEPYTFAVKVSDSPEKYNYTGFIPDMVEALAKRLYFKYEFYHVTEFGRYDKESGKWSGMIGQVILTDETGGEKGADVATAAITITSGRERAVDFLKPFQHLGITAILRRPQQSTTASNQFTFGIFQPLQSALWGLILLSSCVVGLFLWIMNMFNPYEWGGRYKLGLTDSKQANTFNLLGSMWFIFTSLQWQGFERAPRSLASKFLTCVWFVFVTVVLVTYTAGIVNNLFWASMFHRTVSQNPMRPRYIDLAHTIASGDFKYGTVNNSQTYRYLMEVMTGEEFDTLRRYWRSPEGQAQLVKSTDEGLKRVRDPESNYVFLMESLSAKYLASQRPCDLVTVGEPFGSRSYGFAIPNSMPYAWSDQLHSAILEMMEEGDMEDLERRWFTDPSQCWNVTQAERVASDTNAALNVDQPRSVDVATFMGPLILIGIGLVLSGIIAVAEIIYYRKMGQFTPENRPQGEQLVMNAEGVNIQQLN